jgi:hypothetical protein
MPLKNSTGLHLLEVIRRREECIVALSVGIFEINVLLVRSVLSMSTVGATVSVFFCLPPSAMSFYLCIRCVVMVVQGGEIWNIQN